MICGGLYVGCRSTDPTKGLLERQTTTSQLNSLELRSILNDYVKRYANEIEETADLIIASDVDQRIRVNALRWKTNSISSCFQAAARPDPLSAYMDIWILTKQSIALLERPPEDSLFGPWQGEVVDTVRRLESPLIEIQAAIGENVPIGEEFATSFARDYPIDSLYFRRESIAARYTDYLDRIQVGDRDIMEVVGGLDERLDQLNKLSALYAEFLPKQARWQSELLLLESVPASALATPLADFSVVAQSMDRLAEVGETVPGLMEREREYLRLAIGQERVATLGAIEEMRAATMTQLDQQRVEVMGAIQEERVAIMQAVGHERAMATNDLVSYADHVLAQSEVAMDQGLSKVAEQAEHVADHVMKRIAQLGMVGMLLLAGMAWFLHRGTPVTRLRLRVPPADDDEQATDRSRPRRKAA